MKTWLLLAAAAGCALGSGPAWAGDPATAQALFDQAQALMNQERWADACPKLEESQRLDPGGGTVLHLAACREHEGKTATAWAHYQDALASAKRDGRKDRAKVAKAGVERLQPKIHRLRVKVAPKTRKLAGLRVMRDEIVVGEAQWGEALPIDPGARTISAAASGFKSWTAKVEIPAGPGETSVEVPELEAEAPPPAAASGPAPVATALAPPLARGDHDAGDTQRLTGIVVASLGVIGIGVGTVTGLMSISKGNEADNLCDSGDGETTVCPREGYDAGKEAQTFGNIATVGFIAGGALIAGGAVIYLLAPSPRDLRSATVAPLVGPSLAGLAFSGRF